MRKIYSISCCAECPVYTLRRNRIPYCEQHGREIEWDSESSINPALLGFPEWCSLETMTEKDIKDYKKEVKQILKIMEGSSYLDSLQEASYYLNSVIETEKIKCPN